jgi:hypothetical protein
MLLLGAMRLFLDKSPPLLSGYTGKSNAGGNELMYVMSVFRRIVLATAVATSTTSTAAAAEFSLFGVLDFAKEINYEYLETFALSELRKLWDKEVEGFVLCTGLHPTAGTKDWGIYTEEQMEMYVCDEEWKKERLTQLGERLTDIFDNAALPADEKAFTIAAEIEEDALKYTIKYPDIPKFGAGYSMEYGVMRLHFNNMIAAHDLCPGIETVTVYTDKGIETKVVPFLERIFIQPSYTLTKNVDGNTETLAFVKEEVRAVRESKLGLQFIFGKTNSYSIKWLDAVNGMYKYLSEGAKKKSFPGGDIVVYDFSVDMRPEKSTLKYTLEVAHSGGKECPPPRRWVQELIVDEDGDGFIDFVPREDQREYRFKLTYVPPPPVPGVVYANTGRLPEYRDCFAAGEHDVVPLIYSPVYKGHDTAKWIAENCGPIYE